MQVEVGPTAFGVGVEGLGEVLRHRDAVRRRVEDRRCAVAGDEGVRERGGGQVLDLAQQRARGVGVHLGEAPDAQDLVAAQHLEEHELDVAQVRLVVAHGSALPDATDE